MTLIHEKTCKISITIHLSENLGFLPRFRIFSYFHGHGVPIIPEICIIKLSNVYIFISLRGDSNRRYALTSFEKRNAQTLIKLILRKQSTPLITLLKPLSKSNNRYKKYDFYVTLHTLIQIHITAYRYLTSIWNLKV